MLVEEFERQGEYALGEAVGLQVAELVVESAKRHDRLRHRPVAAGTPDVGEILSNELTRVAGVPEISDRHDERVVDDPRHDRPFDVLELQVEVGDVRDEVLARRVAEEGAEDLLGDPAMLSGP